MAPTSTSVDGLDPVEARNYKISRAPQARHRCQDAAQTGSSDGPWHLANTPALNLALSNAYSASLGLPELVAHGSFNPRKPPDADPHVRSCGRGGPVTVSPIPID